MKQILVVATALCVLGTSPIATQLPDPVATFSILGYDPATGEIGGAVQSRVFSAGNGVLWGEAGVGMEGCRVGGVDPGDEAADVVHASARLRYGGQRLQERSRLAARALHEHGHAWAEQIGQAFGGDLLRHRAGPLVEVARR